VVQFLYNNKEGINMAEYVYIQNYTRNGNMGISHFVFDQIAGIATNQVQGAILLDPVSATFKLHKPISCSIRNGLVNVKIHVILVKGAPVDEVCLAIQDNVSNALAMMTEMIPFKIDVVVAGFAEKKEIN
jgi:uncharacterized alkaline shock family protein YloU